jgi:hypothetical protein
VRLQLAIAHYYNPSGGGRHGSLSPNPTPRINALRQVVLQLHRLFGEPSGCLNHLQRRIDSCGDGGGTLRLAICVQGEHHLLEHLNDLREAGGFEVVHCQPTTPRHLGFACHHVLQADHRDFDFSGYLEDDILITDADFFLKLLHFNRCFGQHYLLQPNRIETSEDLKNLRRFYIDGDYNPQATEQYRHAMGQQLCMEHLGQAVCFQQPLNTHSGCFFLNREQAEIYFGSDYWHQEDVSFHSPLESAATLGVMKQFQIMKPSPMNGRFLTVEHAGRNFMGLVAPLQQQSGV